MRPKARGLVQHGSLPSWLEESALAGVILYVMDGPFLFALTGAAQLRADGMSSCCYIINTHNLMSWATSRKEGMSRYSIKLMSSLWCQPHAQFLGPLIIDWLPHCHLHSWIISGWVLAARVSCWLAEPTSNKVMFLFFDQRQLLPQVLADLLGLSSLLFPVG